MAMSVLTPLGASVGTSRPRNRGAIYARFSTKFQHSIEDQIRVCREWAATHGVVVEDRHIFSDSGITGKTHKRAGLTQLINALDKGEVDVAIFYATNRLYRKVYASLQFVEESIMDRGHRCVFVSQNIDTAVTESWSALMSLYAMQDEIQVKMITGQVRAAHEGLAINDRVWGTVTFGYVGVPVEGRETRQGKPATQWTVDPVAAEYVKSIFRWFVVEEYSLPAIARKLNTQNAPLPPRTTQSRWTPLAVRHVLLNRRYIGDWSYGRTEVRWQNKAGYGRQVKREQPRRVLQREHLRIIDDVLFSKAQVTLARRRTAGGRPKGTRLERDMHIVSGLLICPKHQRPLQITNSKGGMSCPACLTGPERALVSLVYRSQAEAMICKRLSDLVRTDPGLVDQAVEACRQHVEAMSSPDPKPIAALEREILALNNQVQFILRNPGETQADHDENSTQITLLRHRRAEIEASLVELRKGQSQPFLVPTRDELRAMMDKLSEVLMQAAAGGERDVRLRARRVVWALTGGRIIMSQQGERLRRRGWLRGTFQVHLLGPILDELRVVESQPKAIDVIIDFRRPTRASDLADEVVDLYDTGMLIKEIARTLSERHGIPVGRALVAKALASGLKARGLPASDGRSRRSTLMKKTIAPTLFDSVFAEVMEQYHAKALYSDIAAKMRLDRNTVTAVVARWHRERNLPMPDGRTRRKNLITKSRKRGEHRDHAA